MPGGTNTGLHRTALFDAASQRGNRRRRKENQKKRKKRKRRRKRAQPFRHPCDTPTPTRPNQGTRSSHRGGNWACGAAENNSAFLAHPSTSLRIAETAAAATATVGSSSGRVDRVFCRPVVVCSGRWQGLCRTGQERYGVRSRHLLTANIATQKRQRSLSSPSWLPPTTIFVSRASPARVQNGRGARCCRNGPTVLPLQEKICSPPDLVCECE